MSQIYTEKHLQYVCSSARFANTCPCTQHPAAPSFPSGHSSGFYPHGFICLLLCVIETGSGTLLCLAFLVQREMCEIHCGCLEQLQVLPVAVEGSTVGRDGEIVIHPPVLSVDRPCRSFQLWAIMNSAAGDTFTHGFGCVCVSVE